MLSLKNLPILGVLLTCAVAFSGCLRDQCDRTHEFIRYDPIYMTAEGMRVDVTVKGPQELKSPGNINYYNGYLLVNELQKGVHVFDNHDPANPINLAFIEIPGNRDIAVRNNILFADMFIDLVAIRMSWSHSSSVAWKISLSNSILRPLILDISWNMYLQMSLNKSTAVTTVGTIGGGEA